MLPVEKGLQSPGTRRQPWRTHHQDPCPKRRPGAPAGVPADRRTSSGLPRGRELVAGARSVDPCDGRPGLRYERHSPADREPGCGPKHPTKRTRRWKSCFSPVLYRGRNAIERMFCRLKDYRRIATRYDKLAANFLSAAYLAATVTYWL